MEPRPRFATAVRRSLAQLARGQRLAVVVSGLVVVLAVLSLLAPLSLGLSSCGSALIGDDPRSAPSPGESSAAQRVSELRARRARVEERAGLRRRTCGDVRLERLRDASVVAGLSLVSGAAFVWALSPRSSVATEA